MIAMAAKHDDWKFASVFLMFSLTEKTITMAVKHDDYVSYLKPESMLTVYLKGTVKETKKAYAKIDTIGIKKPELLLMVGSMHVL